MMRKMCYNNYTRRYCKMYNGSRDNFSADKSEDAGVLSCGKTTTQTDGKSAERHWMFCNSIGYIVFLRMRAALRKRSFL